MAFNIYRSSSLLLALIFLLLSFSSCLAHYCKCECDMSKKPGTGSSVSAGGGSSGGGSIGSPSSSHVDSSHASGSISSGGSYNADGSFNAGDSSSSSSKPGGSAYSPSIAPNPHDSSNIGSGSGSGIGSGLGSGSGSGTGSGLGSGSGSGTGSGSGLGSGSGSGYGHDSGSVTGSGSGSGSGHGSFSGSGSGPGTGTGSGAGTGSGTGTGSGSSTGSGSDTGSSSGHGSGSGTGSGSGSDIDSGSGSGSGTGTGFGAGTGSGTGSGSGSGSGSGIVSGSGSGQGSISGSGHGIVSGSVSGHGSTSGSGSGTGSWSSSWSESWSSTFGANFNISRCINKLYAFGDSYTDTGNAGLLGGLMAFANAPKPGSPYGSSFPGGQAPSFRFSDGRILIDFLSDALQLPPLPPIKNASADFSKGANFAVGGSSSFPGKFYDDNNVGRTLMWKLVPEFVKNQGEWFQQFLDSNLCKGIDTNQCKTQLSHSLFWVGEMAFNDYLRNFGTSITIQSLMEKLVDFKFNLLKTLMDRGAKYVVIQGLPPLGCFPLHMSMSSSGGDRDDTGCVKSANSIAKAHNDLLLKKIGELKIQFPNCFIVYADFWNAFLTIMKSPSKFGFSETSKACCGAGTGMFNFNLHCLCGAPGSSKCQDPSKYISWDGIHLTEAMYSNIAKLFLQGDFCQPPFKQLITAAAGAVGAAVNVKGSAGIN